MSEDHGEIPSDERLSDRGKPPEDEQARNTKPTQIAASYDMFGNPLMPAAADNTRVPGGDRGNLIDRGSDSNVSNSSPQTVPIVYTEKKPLSNNVKIAALVGSILAVGGLVFVLMANPFAKSDKIGGTNSGFKLPSLPGAVLSPHEIFKQCSPSIVTLVISTKAYQVTLGKLDLVSMDDPENPVLAAFDDEEHLKLYRNGKESPMVPAIIVTPKLKLPVIVKLNGTSPMIYIVDKNGTVIKKLEGGLAKWGGTGQGSGFFCRPDVVVTNYHVVSNEDLGVAGYIGGTAQITDNAAKYMIDKKPIAFDKEHDLALLYVPGTNAKVLPMRTDFSALTVGEPVYALGTPRGVAGSLSEGLISADKLRGRDPKNPDLPKLYLQHSAKIDHGNSGGPLVNNHGEVIGVNTAGLGNGTVNLAVVSKFIDDLLSKPEVQAKIDELSKTSQTDLKGG